MIKAEQNHIALVTGGTGGIGTAICQQFARAGLKVAASYQDEAKAKRWQENQKALGFDMHIFPVDIKDFASCEKLIHTIEKTLGPIDILVNNAGITADASLRKMTVEQWQNVLFTNLHGLFNITRHVINSMIDRQYGRIINISSINGEKGQFGQTNYAAAKAGIHGFSKSLAQEVARKGITVNTVSPGYTATEMVKAVDPEILKNIISDIPVGRLAEPEEIARVVCFLAAPESGFITGANFSINGGQHMY